MVQKLLHTEWKIREIIEVIKSTKIINKKLWSVMFGSSLIEEIGCGLKIVKHRMKNKKNNWSVKRHKNTKEKTSVILCKKWDEHRKEWQIIGVKIHTAQQLTIFKLPTKTSKNSIFSMYHISLIVSRGLIKFFFHHFMWFTIKGGLYFFI